MLKELQDLTKEQTLVANTGVQFIDYGFRLDASVTFSRAFVEKLEVTPEGQYHVLRSIERKKTPFNDTNQKGADFVDSETREDVTSAAIYSIQLHLALDIFDGIWLPAPFLKRKGQDQSGRKSFEPGPSNWARLRVVKLDSPDERGFTHRLTLAFDTVPQEMVRGGSYVCPVPEDVRNETRFEFASALRDISWLLEQQWVADWLAVTLRQSSESRPINLPKRRDGDPAKFLHWSLFVVLLQGLEALLDDAAADATRSNAPLPTVWFLNTLIETAAVRPIDVDLVLDIGNSRTCGVLIERGVGADLNIRDATVLELRDLSRPQLVYQEPFRSHLEFVEPWFGNPRFNLASGRRSAFVWPSFVRVGPEALRLNGQSSGSQGDTGLSSPKRYLWDIRANPQPWYFNRTESISTEAKPVIGVIMPLLTQEGDVVELVGGDAEPALQPRFSRASLFTFMVMELLLQALVQMNSPGYRSGRDHRDVPRRLNRVVFSIPTATPVIERNRYKKRCVAAINLLWRIYGWGRPGTGTSAEPEINLDYDEATCTQIVYLYNEIAEKFRKPPRDFLRLLRNQKDPPNGHRLRVASIDIGGGTSDLMILTYEEPAARGGRGVVSVGDALTPSQNFREGFRRAGDDILEAVISEHVLKSTAQALRGAGMSDPDQFLSGFIDDDRDAKTRQLRKLFVTRVLSPVALYLLSQYETVGMFAVKHDPITFAEIVGSETNSLRHVIHFFEEAARSEGARDFSFDQTAFDFDFVGLGTTIEAVINPILSLMCEVIHRFDCDLLLMSGRPSRLPIVRDLVLRSLPISPHRIIFMHEYRVGSWYKFRSRLGTIEDPKTTVVMGALLCALAAGKKATDFALNTESLITTASTANYIGPISRDGIIRDGHVVLARKAGVLPTVSTPLEFNASMFLGFRQLPLERWPGTPLFFLDISDYTASDGHWAMPWRITFRREDHAGDGSFAQIAAANEELAIDQIFDCHGQEMGHDRVLLRMQTLRNPDGYWLDTGKVRLPELGG